MSLSDKLEEKLTRLKKYVNTKAPRGNVPLAPPPCDAAMMAMLNKNRTRHQSVLNRSRGQTRIPHFFAWKCRMPDLPVDILLEIASHMHPLDLLHLSRVSSGLYTALASRGSRVAWMRALQSIPDLPPCPDDMSEVAYASLVFGRNCFACGAEKAYSVDYAIRVRYCEPCCTENIVEGAPVLDIFPDAVLDVAIMLIPAQTSFSFYEIRKTLSRVNPATHLPEDFYLKRDLEAINEWCSALSSPQPFDQLCAWIRERVEIVAARQAHAVMLDAWERLAVSYRPDTLDNRVQRRARVLTLLRQRKHLDTPFEVGSDADSDEDSDYCEVDAQDLTPAVINCVTPPKDADQLDEEQEARYHREDDAYMTWHSVRCIEIEDCYERFMREHGPCDETYDERCHPNRHDGGQLFSALADRDGARRPVDYDTFASDLGLLEEKFYGYERHLASGLAGLLPGPAEWTNWLKRPNALFACPECAKVALPWPDINVHWREEHPDDTIWAVAVDHRPNVKWWRPGEDVAYQILDAVRLGRTTPMYELNEHIEKGRLYCNCGDPSFGPANRQAWAELVLHVYTHLRMNEDRLAAADDGHVWHNDHKIEECIVRLKLEGKVEPAQMRYQSSDASVLARVDAHLARCLAGFVPICRLCEEMTRKDKDMWMVLPPHAEAIMYHISAKHGRTFSEADILFEPMPWYLPRERRHISHWGRFALEKAGSWSESVYLV